MKPGLLDRYHVHRYSRRGLTRSEAQNAGRPEIPRPFRDNGFVYWQLRCRRCDKPKGSVVLGLSSHVPEEGRL